MFVHPCALNTCLILKDFNIKERVMKSCPLGSRCPASESSSFTGDSDISDPDSEAADLAPVWHPALSQPSPLWQWDKTLPACSGNAGQFWLVWIVWPTVLPLGKKHAAFNVYIMSPFAWPNWHKILHGMPEILNLPCFVLLLCVVYFHMDFSLCPGLKSDLNRTIRGQSKPLILW